MRYINKIVYLIILFSLVVFQPNASFAKGDKEGKKNISLPKTTGLPATTWFTINNVNTILRNDGMSDLNGSDSGFEYPAGSNKTVFYESGFIYGGEYKGEWRVGGSAYDHSQLPGRILADGTPENPDLDHVRIYRVRRDFRDPDADFSKEILKDERTKDQVIAQYQKDWDEWPAQYGAPYEDVNGNGQYDASIDIPGVPGADQTIWFVANDLDPSPQQKFYGTLGLGMEMQATFWGYNAGGALGNAMFRKYQLINKGGENIDSMYVCMWSDPDLGDAGDDYTGCDTTLSLGYIYNGGATDAQYGENVPAAGFDFFQGPVVPGLPSDEAIFKGGKREGYKNLPMSSFFFFINSDAVYRDPVQGDPVGARQWRNLFEGKISTTGVPFTDPNTNIPTKFTLSGDPITGRGWVDGILHRPGDRRLGMVAGPFNFAAGDTQEVVVGQFAAGGSVGINRLGAVGLLKFYDLQLQQAYNAFFQVPPSVKPPIVNATPLDQQVALTWGDRPDIYTQTESYDTLGYKFQGYCVYQLPSASSTIEEAQLVETYDLNDLVGSIQSLVFDATTSTSITKFTKFGRNTGISRSILIDKDLVRGGVPIVDGTHYYFAVTAYAYNPDPEAVPNVLETPLTIFDVVPQQPNPGYTYPDPATTITATHTKGASDGKVGVSIVDPSKLNGHTYEINVAKGSSGNTWSLTDKTAGSVKASGLKEGTSAAVAAMTDGLQVTLSGAPNDFKSFTVTANAGGKLDPPEMGTFAFNSNGFPLYNGEDRPAARQQAGGGLWGICTGENGSGLSSFTNFKARVARGSNFDRIVPYDFEIRFTAAGSKSEMAFTDGAHVDIPFEVWNTGIGTPNDPSDDYKLVALVYDVNGNGVFDLDGQDSPVSSGDNDPETDWFYIYDVADHTPGTAGYDAAIAASFDDDGTTSTIGGEVMARLVLVGFNAGSVSDPTFPANVAHQLPEQGTIFRIESTKPNVAGSDVFTFTAPGVTFSADQAKTDVEQINAFPNPYYGVNPREVNKYQKYITFSHLPQKATIRIFNLAGQLVTTIKKDDASPFTMWNLSNDANIPVASGLYIVHVDMPEVGATKILKVAIIQEQQILDRF